MGRNAATRRTRSSAAADIGAWFGVIVGPSADKGFVAGASCGEEEGGASRGRGVWKGVVDVARARTVVLWTRSMRLGGRKRVQIAVEEQEMRLLGYF